jgi:hypothetical protein
MNIVSTEVDIASTEVNMVSTEVDMVGTAGKMCSHCPHPSPAAHLPHYPSLRPWCLLAPGCATGNSTACKLAEGLLPKVLHMVSTEVERCSQCPHQTVARW